MREGLGIQDDDARPLHPDGTVPLQSWPAPRKLVKWQCMSGPDSGQRQRMTA